jgi:hypothetical protein
LPHRRRRTQREPTALQILTDLLRDEMVEDAEGLAILAVERLADGSCLTADQVRRCGLHRIVVQASPVPA